MYHFLLHTAETTLPCLPEEVPPKFEIFADHIEITSSGGLPMGLTQEEFFSGVSKPRNKELMRIFCDVDFGESLGSGMASVMKSYSPANFTFFPHFVRFSVEYINHAILSRESKTSESGPLNAESGRINVESGRINGENGRINGENGRINAYTANLTKNEAKILHIISKEEGLSVINLQLKTELAERTIFRHIASLTQKHLIERRGSKKTGGYWLVDSTHKENS